MRACLVLLGALAACGPTPPGSGGACQALPGDLVITEVFADYQGATGGSDTGKEWFEIYNTTPAPIALAGLTITNTTRDGGRANSHTMREATVEPGRYFVLGSADAERTPAYVDYGYGGDLGELANTGGKLAVACGDTEIDSADYADIKQGHARELAAGQRPELSVNDDPANWCQANDAEFEADNFGTPGADNDCQPIVSGQCNDGGTMRDAVTPGVGDLVITEVMPSPNLAADATGEWFEALAHSDLDLNGVGLDRVDDNAAPDVITSTDCVHVRAGSYVVFARSLDPVANGGLDRVLGTFKFSLIGGSAAAPGDVAIVAGDTVIDAVTWTHSTKGASLQLDPDLEDATANDTETNFCDGTASYGAGDLGTPGAANAQCPLLPPAGMCTDGQSLRAIVTPAAGVLVISEILANPANVTGSTDALREWFEVANVGATAFDLNELVVGRVGATGTPVQSARCISVAAGKYAVFARQADRARNGMLPQVDATFSFGLVDTNGDIQIAGRAGVLDAVHWTSVTSGVAHQLDPAKLTTTANDDDASYCAATTGYGDLSNLGTPGAANAACP